MGREPPGKGCEHRLAIAGRASTGERWTPLHWGTGGSRYPLLGLDGGAPPLGQGGFAFEQQGRL